jgi:hypothetical protein
LFFREGASLPHGDERKLDMKKFISMMMALALTFALAIPAFAGEVSSGSSRTFSASGSASLAASGQYQFNMGAAVNIPTINVYVPTANTNTDKVVLNPYGLKYTLDGEELTDQIISTPIYLGSLSNVPLKVGMNVKATVAGNAALGTKSFAEDTKTTTNSVFLWGQVVDGGSGASVDLTATPSGFASAYDATEGKTGSMILVGADVTRTGLYTIPAADDATDTTNTNWACAKFFGDAVKAPTTPWANGDTVTLAITFTFTPSMD